MAILNRSFVNNFTQIPSLITRDSEAPLISLGLYGFMNSKPENWEFSLLGLEDQLKESRQVIINTINKLVELGYLDKIKRRINGRQAVNNYILHIGSDEKIKRFTENNTLSEKNTDRNISTMRRYEIGFTQVPNHIFLDVRASMKAKGLYFFMASKPSGWKFSLRGLESQLADSKKVIIRIINELVELGYMDKIKKRVNGKQAVNDYILHQEPKIISKPQNVTTSQSKEDEKSDANITECQNDTLLQTPQIGSECQNDTQLLETENITEYQNDTQNTESPFGSEYQKGTQKKELSNENSEIGTHSNTKEVILKKKEEEENLFSFISNLRSNFIGIKFSVDKQIYFISNSGFVLNYDSNKKVSFGRARDIYKTLHENWNDIKDYFEEQRAYKTFKSAS